MNGQWQPPQLPPMPGTPDHAATMGQRGVGGGGGGARGGSISPGPGVAGGINGGYGGNARPSAMAYGRDAYDNVPGDVGGQGGDGEGSDSEERPRRQKRRRQSTKKGPMTATEAELAELDEGLGEDENTSWKKSSGQRRSTGVSSAPCVL